MPVTASEIFQVATSLKDLKPFHDFHPRPSLESESKQLVERVRDGLKDSLDADGIEVPNDDFLELTLRVWGFSIPDAIRVAGNFARFRTRAGWDYTLNPRDVETALRSEMHWLLPGTDNLKRGILVYNARHLMGAGCAIEELQKMGSFLMEKAVQREEVRKNGIVFIVDLQGVGLGMLSAFSFAGNEQRDNDDNEDPCLLQTITLNPKPLILPSSLSPKPPLHSLPQTLNPKNNP